MNDPFLPEELRLFIACELPESWIAALAAVTHTLASPASRVSAGYAPKAST